MRTLAWAVATLIAGSAHGQTIVYDTFNEADQANLFDCCNVVQFHGRQDGHRLYVAIPFTPAVDARVTEIDLALSTIFDAGGDGLWIQVMGSSSGLPGRIKHSFFASGFPSEGQCCAFTTETATGIPVKGGHTYWIELKGLGLSQYGWNLNTLGMSGAYAVRDKDWTMTEGPLPAVRIIAK